MKILNNLKEWYTIQTEKRYQEQILNSEKRQKVIANVQLTDAQKKEIDDFYIKHYGTKIDYTSHRTYLAYSGVFDVKYMPETIYIPEFEYFMNPYTCYNSTFYDKNVIPMIVKSSGFDIKIPTTFFKSVKGLISDANNNLLRQEDFLVELNNIGKVFIKETVDTGGGNGCLIADFNNGFDMNTGKSVKEIIAKFGKDFAIQDLIKCHDLISNIYPHSVNTFRILTYRWRDTIVSIPAAMRIGRGGGYLDNAHQGGIFTSIQQNGQLGEYAQNEWGGDFISILIQMLYLMKL